MAVSQGELCMHVLEVLSQCSHRKSSWLKTALSVALLSLLTSQAVQAGVILADSQQDWINATNDGFGVGNVAVVAGSAADAAQ